DQDHERAEERASTILDQDRVSAKDQNLRALLAGTSENDQRAALSFVCELLPRSGTALASIIAESAETSASNRSYAVQVADECTQKTIRRLFQHQLEVADLYNRHRFSCDAAVARK